MDELKKCPFCGSVSFAIRQEYGRNGCAAVCGDCKAAVGWFYSAEEVTAAWNRRADGWISVYERMPELGAHVITCSHSGAIRISSLDIKDEWYPQGLNYPIEVTHWMPLPSPPEV